MDRGYLKAGKRDSLLAVEGLHCDRAPSTRSFEHSRTANSSHPISHPTSDYSVGSDGTISRGCGHEVPDFRDRTEQLATSRDGRQRITKPLHCHCANPAYQKLSILGSGDKWGIGTQMAPYRLLLMALSMARAAAASVFANKWPYVASVNAGVP